MIGFPLYIPRWQVEFQRNKIFSMFYAIFSNIVTKNHIGLFAFLNLMTV